MEGICRNKNRVRWLVAWHSRRVSTTPVVVPLQGLVVYAGDRLGAAVDVVLQLATLLSSVGCRVDQAKVQLHGQ